MTTTLLRDELNVDRGRCVFYWRMSCCVAAFVTASWMLWWTKLSGYFYCLLIVAFILNLQAAVVTEMHRKSFVNIHWGQNYRTEAFSALTLLVGWQPVKTEWWGAGMVICLERGADLHMAQLMPLPLTVSCFCKIQIGFTFLVPAHLDSPGKRVVKRVRACVCK